MPAGTTLAAASLALSAAGGAAKTISGAVQRNKAKQAMKGYDRQTLTNPYDNLAPSTLGAEMRQESSARRTASSLEALQQGGLRAMSGGVGDIAALEAQEMSDIQRSIDEQMMQIGQLQAQGDMQVQRMQERREETDISGLSRQMEAGRQDMWGGIGDIAQVGMNAAYLNSQGAFDGMGGNKPPQRNPGDITQIQGFGTGSAQIKTQQSGASAPSYRNAPSNGDVAGYYSQDFYSPFNPPDLRYR